jgi:hypothetical protein
MSALCKADIPHAGLTLATASPVVDRLRHAELVEQCPFAAVYRKTFAQAEFFSV